MLLFCQCHQITKGRCDSCSHPYILSSKKGSRGKKVCRPIWIKRQILHLDCNLEVLVLEIPQIHLSPPHFSLLQQASVFTKTVAEEEEDKLLSLSTLNFQVFNNNRRVLRDKAHDCVPVCSPAPTERLLGSRSSTPGSTTALHRHHRHSVPAKNSSWSNLCYMTTLPSMVHPIVTHS